MANVKIFNLDEVIAAEAEATIVWLGAEHRVAGLTPEIFLKMKQFQRRSQETGGDEAGEFAENLNFIAALVPSLEAHRDELMRLRLPALQKLVEFVLQSAGLATGDQAAAEAAGADGADGEPGESTPPA